MPIPLYMDQDSSNKVLVQALRSSGIDVVTADEAGNAQLPDDEQLAFATSHGRMIYTGNRRDFARLNDRWVRSGRDHAGIVARTRSYIPIRLEIAALTLLCTESSPEDVRNRMFYI
jgi:hypothetical protein